MEASEVPMFLVDEKRVTREIQGYWMIYKVTQCYGGREEGGWWFDMGEMIACVPHTRKGMFINYGDDVEPNLSLVEWVDDIPADMKALQDRLVEQGYGKFDNEYRSTRQRHDSLSICWGEKIVPFYPEQEPSYE